MKKEQLIKENEEIIINNLYYFNKNIENALKNDKFVKTNQYVLSMNLYISNLKLLEIIK